MPVGNGDIAAGVLMQLKMATCIFFWQKMMLILIWAIFLKQEESRITMEPNPFVTGKTFRQLLIYQMALSLLKLIKLKLVYGRMPTGPYTISR